MKPTKEYLQRFRSTSSAWTSKERLSNTMKELEQKMQLAYFETYFAGLNNTNKNNTNK